jgi:hypothetical protein
MTDQRASASPILGSKNMLGPPGIPSGRHDVQVDVPGAQLGLTTSAAPIARTANK